MKAVFEYILATRKNFIRLLDGCSEEQLNVIPPGFNNNIIWNFGHIVISTQALCYLRSGIRPGIVIPFVDKYKKGTRPEGLTGQEEIDLLKEQAIDTLHSIQLDFNNKVFDGLIPFSTDTFGLPMQSIEEVITCTLAHDSMHWGYAMAQRKLV